MHLGKQQAMAQVVGARPRVEGQDDTPGFRLAFPWPWSHRGISHLSGSKFSPKRYSYRLHRSRPVAIDSSCTWPRGSVHHRHLPRNPVLLFFARGGRTEQDLLQDGRVPRQRRLLEAGIYPRLRSPPAATPRAWAGTGLPHCPPSDCKVLQA